MESEMKINYAASTICDHCGFENDEIRISWGVMLAALEGKINLNIKCRHCGKNKISFSVIPVQEATTTEKSKCQT